MILTRVTNEPKTNPVSANSEAWTAAALVYSIGESLQYKVAKTAVRKWQGAFCGWFGLLSEVVNHHNQEASFFN